MLRRPSGQPAPDFAPGLKRGNTQYRSGEPEQPFGAHRCVQSWHDHAQHASGTLAAAGSRLFGDAQWRESALALLFYALGWLVVTLWLTRELGRRRQREYRNLCELLED